MHWYGVGGVSRLLSGFPLSQDVLSGGFVWDGLRLCCLDVSLVLFLYDVCVYACCQKVLLSALVVNAC